MIRPATTADTERLVEMTLRFLQTTDYGRLLRVNEPCIRKLVALVLEHGVVLVCERVTLSALWAGDGPAPQPPELVGMVAMTALPHLLTGEPYAEEQAWWVEPEHRGGTVGPRLLAAAEAWARENGLKMIKVVAPEGGDVGKFYTKLGYEAVETAFVKAL